MVIVSAGSHSHVGSTVSTTLPGDCSSFGGLSTYSQCGPKRHSPSTWNVYVSMYELTSAEQPLHSNCDCFALSRAAGASMGWPLNNSADATLPSLRIDS